ncbi:MAG TPA: hypothetical protein VFM10_02495, partial [Terriglobales bacterium]|nr:hypothetical protein [Terriglobales bacterium]
LPAYSCEMQKYRIAAPQHPRIVAEKERSFERRIIAFDLLRGSAAVTYFARKACHELKGLSSVKSV